MYDSKAVGGAKLPPVHYILHEVWMMNIVDYLKKHTLLHVGRGGKEYICYETIVEDPIELIMLAQKSNCYITGIRWWDRVSIDKGSTLGIGGPRDPNDPDYFYVETYIEKTFTIDSTVDDYYEYLQNVKLKYPQHQFFPAFDIKLPDASSAD